MRNGRCWSWKSTRMARKGSLRHEIRRRNLEKEVFRKKTFSQHWRVKWQKKRCRRSGRMVGRILRVAEFTGEVEQARRQGFERPTSPVMTRGLGTSWTSLRLLRKIWGKNLTQILRYGAYFQTLWQPFGNHLISAPTDKRFSSISPISRSVQSQIGGPTGHRSPSWLH